MTVNFTFIQAGYSENLWANYWKGRTSNRYMLYNVCILIREVWNRSSKFYNAYQAVLWMFYTVFDIKCSLYKIAKLKWGTVSGYL